MLPSRSLGPEPRPHRTFYLLSFVMYWPLGSDPDIALCVALSIECALYFLLVEFVASFLSSPSEEDTPMITTSRARKSSYISGRKQSDNEHCEHNVQYSRGS